MVGDLFEDLITIVDRDPTRGSVNPASILSRRGGSAANIAAFCAEAGKPSRFVGQVGNDLTADALVASMTRSGVDVRVSRSGSTGRAVVLVDAEGVSTSLVDRGSSSQLLDIDADALDDVMLVHLPGWVFVEDPLATKVGEFVGDAIQRAIPITLGCLTTTALQAFGVEEFRELVRTIGPKVVFCNRAEAEALGGGRQAIEGADLTVITNGARPTVLASHNGAARSVEVDAVEQVIDTTGAGDAFIAGFLVASLDKLTAATAAKSGHLLAGQVLRHYGANLGATRVEP